MVCRDSGISAADCLRHWCFWSRLWCGGGAFRRNIGRMQANRRAPLGDRMHGWASRRSCFFSQLHDEGKTSSNGLRCKSFARGSRALARAAQGPCAQCRAGSKTDCYWSGQQSRDDHRSLQAIRRTPTGYILLGRSARRPSGTLRMQIEIRASGARMRDRPGARNSG